MKFRIQKGGIQKGGTNELIYKTEIELQMSKTNLWLSGGKRVEGINREMWIDIYAVLYIKQITILFKGLYVKTA